MIPMQPYVIKFDNIIFVENKLLSYYQQLISEDFTAIYRHLFTLIEQCSKVVYSFSKDLSKESHDKFITS